MNNDHIIITINDDDANEWMNEQQKASKRMKIIKGVIISFIVIFALFATSQFINQTQQMGQARKMQMQSQRSDGHFPLSQFQKQLDDFTEGNDVPPAPPNSAVQARPGPPEPKASISRPLRSQSTLRHLQPRQKRSMKISQAQVDIGQKKLLPHICELRHIDPRKYPYVITYQQPQSRPQAFYAHDMKEVKPCENHSDVVLIYFDCEFPKYPLHLKVKPEFNLSRQQVIDDLNKLKEEICELKEVDWQQKKYQITHETQPQRKQIFHLEDIVKAEACNVCQDIVEIYLKEIKQPLRLRVTGSRRDCWVDHFNEDGFHTARSHSS